MAQKKTSPSLTSLAASEDSALGLKQPDLFGQSPFVNKTPSAKPSSESIGPTSQFTTTSTHSTGRATATSSRAATHANPSPLPGSKKARQMTATSGRRCLKLLNTKDPAGSWLKTLLVTSQWASTRCCLTWKAKATPRGRLLFQLAPSMPRTDATASGLWPTPTGQDNAQVRGQGKTIGTNRGTTLGGAVRMWPTPAAHEARLGYQDRTTGKKGSQKSLTTEVIDQLGGRQATTGQLNPQWVAWLMGFPTGHTDLKPSEMPSSRKSLSK